MSQLSASKDQELGVINVFETLLLFIAFLTILIFLYPKGSLEKKVLAENSNHTLTSLYLKNLIKLNPQDSSLVLAMAKTLYQQQKIELASELLQILESNPDDKIKKESTILHLTINNEKLKSIKDEDKKESIVNKSRELLNSISTSNIEDIQTNKNLYQIALAINEKKTALKFNMDIIRNSQNDEYLYWLKNAHYLSDDINDDTTDIFVLKKLLKEDDKSNDIWLNALLPKLKTDKEMQALKVSLKDEQLANFYIYNKQYLKANKLYLSLLNKSKNIKDKKNLLLKSIKTLTSVNLVKKAALLAHKYENDFLNDVEMRKTLLKLYLSANKPNLAKKLSLKIIKQKGKS
jgi:hypothetical protein